MSVFKPHFSKISKNEMKPNLSIVTDHVLEMMNFRRVEGFGEQELLQMISGSKNYQKWYKSVGFLAKLQYFVSV